MDKVPTAEQIDVLTRYAAGQIGTRDAIEAAGLDDYADLVIALATNDLDFHKPTPSARRDAALAQASAILQPLLRRGAGNHPDPDRRSTTDSASPSLDN